jgi:hypothetical protein
VASAREAYLVRREARYRIETDLALEMNMAVVRGRKRPIVDRVLDLPSPASIGAGQSAGHLGLERARARVSLVQVPVGRTQAVGAPGMVVLGVVLPMPRARAMRDARL